MKKESEEISREEIAALLARESMSEKMTREQAIDYFRTQTAYLGGKDKQACEIAILAIAALSAEPCDDAISRQSAIRTFLGKVHDDYPMLSDVMIGILEQLPSVTPKPRWIPVSEKLPKEGKTVIASTKYGVYPEAKYTKEYGWLWAYEAGADYWVELEDVTAWMPLPKLYVPDTNIGKMSEIPIGSNGVELQESEGKDV